MAAPTCVLLRHSRAAWLLAAAVTWTAFAISLGLMFEVAANGTISYAIGGWEPKGFVNLALKKGYRMSFQASSDHGSTHISASIAGNTPPETNRVDSRSAVIVV